MTDTTSFDSIARGLREAIEMEKGQSTAAKLHRPQDIDVAQLRHSLGLTQSEFAAKFCISLGTCAITSSISPPISRPVSVALGAIRPLAWGGRRRVVAAVQ